jgi:hypothetical protein
MPSLEKMLALWVVHRGCHVRKRTRGVQGYGVHVQYGGLPRGTAPPRVLPPVIKQHEHRRQSSKHSHTGKDAGPRPVLSHRPRFSTKGDRRSRDLEEEEESPLEIAVGGLRIRHTPERIEPLHRATALPEDDDNGNFAFQTTMPVGCGPHHRQGCVSKGKREGPRSLASARLTHSAPLAT